MSRTMTISLITIVHRPRGLRIKFWSESAIRELWKVWVFAIFLTLPASVLAQTTDELINNITQASDARLNGIKNYVIIKRTMGVNSFEYFEKESSSQNGETFYFMRNIPIGEIQERHSPDNLLSKATPEQLEDAAAMLDYQAPLVALKFRSMLAGSDVAGIGGGLLASMLMNPPQDKPWLSPNPGDMMGMYATMLDAAAKGKRMQEKEKRNAPAEARQEREDRAALISRSTTIVERTTVDGVDVFDIEADGLNLTQQEDGWEVTFNRARMSVSATTYLPLHMTIEGVMRDGKVTRAFKIEREDMDYRSVPSCKAMCQPFRSVMRLSGFMSPEEEAQMLEMKAQLEQVKQQMAGMTSTQQAMLMRQLGPQMEMMEKMAAGGGIEVVSNIVQLRCNTELPKLLEIAQVTMVGAMAGGAPTSSATSCGAISAFGGVAPGEGGATGDGATGSDGTGGGATGGDATGGGATGGDATGGDATGGGVSSGGRIPDGTRPYYVDKDGIGVIRYSGSSGEYFLMINRITGNNTWQRDVLAGPMGAYLGPDVGIFIGSLNMMGVPFDQIELELYQKGPRRTAARFRPEINSDRAEGLAGCGTVSSTGACSNTQPP